MAWNGYIDSVVGSSKGSCDKAAIIGLVGGGSWTTDAHAQHIAFLGPEAQLIAKAMQTEDFTTFQAKGIFLNSEKYQFLRVDQEEGLALGKKKDQGSITIQKSVTAVVIAHTAEGKVQGDTNTAVAGVVNYLKGMNM